MTISTVERNVRAMLPVMRMMQAYVPLWLVRWTENRDMTRVTMPTGVAHEVVSADDVRCEWIIPQNSADDRVLLYLHGGGFIYRLSAMHRKLVAHLAQKMGLRALLVEYRVAPEHPFPAALDDCVTAYRWLLKEGFAAQDIVVAGDSAGGNLTLASLMQLRESGDPLPAAAACLSPVIDMTDRGGMLAKAKDPLLHPKAVKLYNQSYVAGSNARNPLISPAFGDWHGLPPLLIHAGEDEILREDALRSEALAKAAGVDARLEIYPRMWHVWQLYLTLPQATQSLDDIAGFLVSHLGEKQHS